MGYLMKRERGTVNGEHESALPNQLLRSNVNPFEARDESPRSTSRSPLLAASPLTLRAAFGVRAARVPVPRRATSGGSLRASRVSGFTLLEMLAVIVLIGIIGAVVVTQVGKNVDKGKYGAGKAQLMTLSQKIENYALDNGSPPQQLDDLMTKPANATNWQGPYAKESELKDPWGHSFGYQYPGQHGSFDLIFYGQDGKPGGDGYSQDVGNWQ